MCVPRKPPPRPPRPSLQGLAHEGQRLQASVTALQRELAARDSELALRGEEVAGLREAQRGAQSQINQYIADLQVGALLSVGCALNGWVGAWKTPPR